MGVVDVADNFDESVLCQLLRDGCLRLHLGESASRATSGDQVSVLVLTKFKHMKLVERRLISALFRAHSTGIATKDLKLVRGQRQLKNKTLAIFR